MPNSPLSRYSMLIKNCEIRKDTAQSELMHRLQKLYSSITAEGFFDRKPGLLRRVMGARLHADRPYGMYIWGDVGRGKSMVMDIFFESLPFKEKKRVHFHAFMLQVHARLHTLRKEGQTFDPLLIVANEIAKSYQVLCFDEMQVNDVADAMILSRLFTEIFEKGTIVLFTSNRPPEDLYKDGLQRASFEPFIRLLHERIEIVELSADEDYRMRDIATLARVYLTPLNDGSNAELEQIFRIMSHKAACVPQEITTGKRGLTVPRSCRDICWFTFSDLCAKPLGADDYLHLAGLYRTFFIAGIPQMSKDLRNEAKRFVTLIDVLYENHCNLICTAAVEPEELYPAGDGSFEFARTASRLTEMQTIQYLHKLDISSELTKKQG